MRLVADGDDGLGMELGWEWEEMSEWMKLCFDSALWQLLGQGGEGFIKERMGSPKLGSFRQSSRDSHASKQASTGTWCGVV